MRSGRSKNGARPEQSFVSSVVRTFSDMAFIDAAETSNLSEGLRFTHIVHISFSQPETGRIALFLPYECKKLIVENIYGKDWDSLHATEIDDCLLELSNVLAGNFLNEYCGKEARHEISLPELLFDDTELGNNKDFIDFFFDAEGCPFKVSISCTHHNCSQHGEA